MSMVKIRKLSDSSKRSACFFRRPARGDTNTHYWVLPFPVFIFTFVAINNHHDMTRRKRHIRQQEAASPCKAHRSGNERCAFFLNKSEHCSLLRLRQDRNIISRPLQNLTPFSIILVFEHYWLTCSLYF